MKTLPGKIFTVFIVLVETMNVYAGKGAGAGPPAPTGKGTAALSPPPPPPPGLPIDENIFILFSVAVFFGIYIIYKYNLNSKTPI